MKPPMYFPIVIPCFSVSQILSGNEDVFVITNVLPKLKDENLLMELVENDGIDSMDFASSRVCKFSLPHIVAFVTVPDWRVSKDLTCWPTRASGGFISGMVNRIPQNLFESVTILFPWCLFARYDSHC